MFEGPNKLTQPEDQQDNELERRFSEPEVHFLRGEAVPIHDVAPEKLKTEVPTVFGLGWSATPTVYKDNILGLAKNGRRVISPDAPHGISHEKVGTGELNYPAAELRKVAALMETLDAKGIAQVDAVAHSESGIYIAIAAALYPERFRNLVFVDAAGMIGDDNVARLGVGFSLDIIGQVVKELREKKGAPAKEKGLSADPLAPLKVLAGNPKQSIRSVFAIADSDLREILASLKRQGKGISIIHAVDDKAFPMEKLQKTLGLEHVDGVYSIRGTHNEVILNPKPTTALIDQALTALEKRKTGRT